MDPNEPLLAQRQVLSPTQLVAAARELLERGLPLMWLEGELSNFMRAKSGHLYFTLKDVGAQVRCAMFRPRAMHVRFAPADGQHVLIRARVTLYEPRGEFQLQVEHMEEAGLGALQLAFDQLKRRLQAEGLFASERKRPLPALPRSIGVVTSPNGAAIRDVLAVLARRFPMVAVDIYPSLVQGNEAAAGLRKALAAADHSGRHDLIVLTRGGGSLEDLWSFNDEALARLIHGSATPVVSAVGHEIDFTIADFVADLRAPTPSAAAELIVPDQVELQRRLEQVLRTIDRQFHRVLERRGQRLDNAFARLQAQHPLNRLGQQRQRLDNAHQRLLRAMAGSTQQRQSRLHYSHARLIVQHPRSTIVDFGERTQAGHRALRAALAQLLRQRAEVLRTLARTLNALNPLSTLERGYAIAFDANGQVVRNVHSLVIDGEVELRFAAGTARAKVLSISDLHS